MAHRLEAMGQKKYKGLTVLNNGHRTFNGKINLDSDAITIPLRWKKPRRIFVNSMSDLFHERSTFEFIDMVFAVMALCQQHTFQVLTKRPKRMAEYLQRTGKSIEFLESAAREIGYTFKFTDLDGRTHGMVPWPIPNIWLGTSVEDQQTADSRIPHLLDCPAAVRFLSCEPLLGAINLRLFSTGGLLNTHLVIVGGESGPCARQCHVDWIRSIINQCKNTNVPVFVKQLGANPVLGFDGGISLKDLIKDRKGGNPEEWSNDLRVREMPEVRK